ncbi:MAG: hypothetical protein J1F64_11175, partial [Oscillospiraceae bacterium]|nr:hypothetical protein [Oscillospiraceae bacterium]
VEETSKMVYNKYIKLEVLIMPRYKKSAEERATEKERREKILNFVHEMGAGILYPINKPPTTQVSLRVV